MRDYGTEIYDHLSTLFPDQIVSVEWEKQQVAVSSYSLLTNSASQTFLTIVSGRVICKNAPGAAESLHQFLPSVSMQHSVSLPQVPDNWIFKSEAFGKSIEFDFLPREQDFDYEQAE